MRLFFLLAAAGLVISAAAHFSTYAGYDPQEAFPYIWLLHIGIFLVFLPAIAVQSGLPRDGKGNTKLFAFAPRWMQLAAYVLFAYAFVNFAVFMFRSSSGSPSERNAKFVLQSHGRVIRELTAQEYHFQKALVVRGFSGHWMLFYAAAMTTLSSAMRYRKTVTNTGLVSTPTYDGRKGIPIWVHTIFAVVLQMTGFFLGPLIFIGSMMMFHWNLGCFTAVAWFLTPWPGLALALYLLGNKLPAVCPQCGGRAYWISAKGNHFRCNDCNWTGG